MLIGKYGGNQIASDLRLIVKDDIHDYVHKEDFHKEIYESVKDDENTNFVKKTLNYFVAPRCRKSVLDDLMSKYFPNEKNLVQEFYMLKPELLHMHESGMIIGSHSVNHPLMSKLSKKEQSKEISSSFDYLEFVVGKLRVKTYCRPYGRYHSFSNITEELLYQQSCLMSFNVESRDIDCSDLTNRPHALPRYDCNELSFGFCRNLD